MHVRPFSKIKKLTSLRSNPEDFVLRTLGRKREKLTSRDLVIWPERQKMELAPDFFETFVALGKHFFSSLYFYSLFFLCRH